MVRNGLKSRSGKLIKREVMNGPEGSAVVGCGSLVLGAVRNGPKGR